MYSYRKNWSKKSNRPKLKERNKNKTSRSKWNNNSNTSHIEISDNNRMSYGPSYRKLTNRRNSFLWIENKKSSKMNNTYKKE
jgi:hypothetical protein